MDIATKVKKGGKVLALRQFLYMGLSFANIMVIARILGPVNYGIASITLNYFFFILWFSGLSMGDYMIKQETLEDDVVRTLASFQIIFGSFIVLLLLFMAPVLAWASEQPEITPLLRCIAFALLFEMMAGFSNSLLRRDLEFAYVGGIEMLAQFCVYATSLTLVLTGASYWAPIIGVLVGSIVKMALAYRKAPFPLRLNVKKEHLLPALKFGVTLSGASALSNLKLLLVPLGVTPILGIEAAGIVNLTVRLTQQLSLLRQVTRFMSLGVLSKFASDKERLVRVASKGMAYQALMIGPALALFAVFSTWLVPLVFGQEWLV
ncbi:MAG: oligosaccharide flippase family protein, partial [Oceanidesulfovibrio sp.]